MRFDDLWRACGPFRWVLAILPVAALLAAFLLAPSPTAYQATAEIQVPVSAGLSAPWQATQRLDDIRLAVMSPSLQDQVKKRVPAASGADLASLEVDSAPTSSFALVRATSVSSKVAEEVASVAGLTAVDRVLSGLLPNQQALVDQTLVDLEKAKDDQAALGSGSSPQQRTAADKVANLLASYSREEESLRSMQLYQTRARSGELQSGISSARVDPSVSRGQFLAAVGVGAIALSWALILAIGTWRVAGATPPTQVSERQKV